MAYLRIMGIINPNTIRTKPQPGFHTPAFRYFGNNWRDSFILAPIVENDRITAFQYYDPAQKGCHPVWNDGKISGASSFIPHQAALYAFRFPDNTTYVAVRELIIGAIGKWFNETPEQMLNCSPATLQEAKQFCEGHLPASQVAQMEAIASYATRENFGIRH